MLEQLFISLVAIFAALAYAPPIALTYFHAFRAWFFRTRFGKLFLPKSERSAIEQVTIVDLTAAALNTGMAIPAALRAVEMSLGAPHNSLSEQQNAQNNRFRQTPSRLGNKRSRSALRLQNKQERTLDQVAKSLLMGATWAEAWEGVSKKYAILSDILAPAWEDGAAPVPLLERTSAILRLTQQSRANEAAARLGARLVAPLALCFLPAFIFIGIVPIVVIAAKHLF
ncbi:type II secretion system F family protein [Arcanobacterium hippocoleae]|uniref:Type II secretion system protein GspF domain-containing protein n=1 Tax=Arcanobacterium hippocoleae TaxID=149017 RepID=A0ABU1T3P2_9ACTO|nr:type II secretion system F family protein [Arcanobacterium hippocoleae]MDR6939481.1 hypothetical protein [Arcanobacterium hippocoleae]